MMKSFCFYLIVVFMASNSLHYSFVESTTSAKTAIQAIREKYYKSPKWHTNCSPKCKNLRLKIASHLVYYDFDTYRKEWETKIQSPLFDQYFPECRPKKKARRFFLLHIYALTMAKTRHQCVNTCYRETDCYSANYVPYAEACYLSKGPYRNERNKKYYWIDSEIDAYHYELKCRQRHSKLKSRLKTSSKVKPGRPYFKPADWTAGEDGDVIIDGKVYRTTPHSNPWLVNIEQKLDGSRCSGVLITSIRFSNNTSSDLVLTAANCVCKTGTKNLTDITKLKVEFGKVKLGLDEFSLQTRKVDKIFVHESYNGDPKNGYDLALLKLDKRVNFNRFIIPVRLPTRKTPKTTLCFASGWKMIQVVKNTNKKAADTVFQRVPVRFFPKGQCSKYWNGTFANSTMICAKFPKNDVKDCKMDYGAPVTCPENDGYTLYGLGSLRLHKKQCVSNSYSHLSTKVTAFLSWIKHKDKNADFDQSTIQEASSSIIEQQIIPNFQLQNNQTVPTPNNNHPKQNDQRKRRARVSNTRMEQKRAQLIIVHQNQPYEPNKGPSGVPKDGHNPFRLVNHRKQWKSVSD